MLFSLGYGLSAAAYSLLLLMLFAVRKVGLAKYLLSFATFITIVWAVTHLGYLDIALGQENLVKYDSVRQWAWMLFIASCLRNQFSSLFSFLSRPETLGIMILPTVVLICAVFGLLPSTYQFSIQTMLAVQALVLLEIVYRQSDKEKWAFKPLVLYLGALSLFDFVTYANATMVNELSWNFFAARGYIYLALMPFLVLAIRRIQNWGIDIYVSREVVLHSTLLFVAGLYLMVMALIGYVVKYLGGSWGLPVQVALVIVSLVLLVSLFMSHQFRNTIKVFITKHFYANQYDYREEWVKLTERLEKSEYSQTNVYLTALEAYLAGVGYSHGCLIKIKGQEKDIVALIEQGATLEQEEFLIHAGYIAEFCKTKHWIVDFDELRGKPDLYEGLVNKEELVQSYTYQLAIPLYQHDALWGLVFMQPYEQDRRSLNWELRDYLNALTAQITNFIFHEESSKALAENAQFAAFNRMSAFVVHDLKNVLAQINMILANAQQHKSNPEFIEDTFETLEHTQERMNKMLKQLTTKNIELKQHSEMTDINMLLSDLIAQKCAAHAPIPKLEANDEVAIELDAEKFSSVMYHLISNAQQATDKSGTVKVTLNVLDKHVRITIEDDGCGMTEHFIENRLFKPFDTTKGNAGMGIGAYDAKQCIEELGGNIKVISEVDKGSEFVIQLPIMNRKEKE